VLHYYIQYTMEQNSEEWRQYEPYPCYWVSNLGRIKRLYKNGNEKYLKPCVTKAGYLWIDLIRRPPRVRGNVNVMVATCFINNPEHKPYVDHINGDKSDNRVSNLRWATNSENQRNIINPRSSNTSGCTGVCSKRYQGKHTLWYAAITVAGNKIYLGYYHDYDDAVKARREAEIQYFGEFCPNRNI
jgi:hypothetical protein